MLRSRISVCLLLHRGGLYKTVQFGNPKYVGDPINAVRIFNEKEVDELIFLDIDATQENREPNYDLIRRIAVECRMPFCYGGGIKTSEQGQRIISLGAEKLAISSQAIEKPSVITELAGIVGSQSVVCVVDVKKKRGFLGSRWVVCTHRGKKELPHKLSNLTAEFQERGAGEVLVNSIDNDGVMKGYDFGLVDSVRESIDLPMTILGGAGSYDDLSQGIERYGIVGVAAGSLFVFKGKYRAVLIRYPSIEEKKEILNRHI